MRLCGERKIVYNAGWEERGTTKCEGIESMQRHDRMEMRWGSGWSSKGQWQDNERITFLWVGVLQSGREQLYQTKRYHGIIWTTNLTSNMANVIEKTIIIYLISIFFVRDGN